MTWRQGQAYGQDLRDRVLADRGSLSEVAARFAASQSYVACARSRRRRLGKDTPGAQCNHVPAKLSGLEQPLSAHVEAHCDQTLAQLCLWVQAEHGIRVGVTAMHKPLVRLGLRLKKVLACQRTGTLAQGHAFRAWVQQFLAPELQTGAIVVMDNLGTHKVAGIAQAIAAARAQLRYLPPYSPDFNPIEQVFAKLKALLRRTAARAVAALWSAFGSLLDEFDPGECERYIRHAGYGKSA